ncbi:MAG: hypothetical protein ACYDAY_11335 [Candidatus Dormibacteria bacterium]
MARLVAILGLLAVFALPAGAQAAPGSVNGPDVNGCNTVAGQCQFTAPSDGTGVIDGAGCWVVHITRTDETGTYQLNVFSGPDTFPPPTSQQFQSVDLMAGDVVVANAMDPVSWVAVHELTFTPFVTPPSVEISGGPVPMPVRRGSPS